MRYWLVTSIASISWTVGTLRYSALNNPLGRGRGREIIKSASRRQLRDPGWLLTKAELYLANGIFISSDQVATCFLSVWEYKVLEWVTEGMSLFTCTFLSGYACANQFRERVACRRNQILGEDFVGTNQIKTDWDVTSLCWTWWRSSREPPF